MALEEEGCECTTSCESRCGCRRKGNICCPGCKCRPNCKNTQEHFKAAARNMDCFPSTSENPSDYGNFSEGDSDLSGIRSVKDITFNDDSS